MAVHGDRITAIGERASILRRRGPSTRVVDAPRGLLCAGIHDAHAHLVMTGVARLEVDLHGLGPTGVRDRLAAAAAGRAPRRWVIGRGFDPLLFPGDGVWAREILDAACPSHPVLARSHDYHSAALNSVALEQAGFLPTPPEIPGGRIERDESGAPNGLLREAAAVAAEARAGDLTEAEQAAATLAVSAELHAAGITALHDMSGSRRQGVLRALDDAGDLPLDVFATVTPNQVGDEALRRPGSRLRIIGAKAFLDGALGSRTALLLEPYEGDAAHLGIPVLPPEDVHDLVAAASAHGLAACLHAIGNGAVRLALDAITSRGDPALRHRVEHAQMVHDDDLGRFAAHGIVASVQPVHMAEDACLVPRHWGARSREAFPLRRLADAGAPLAFGSDTPIETFDVLDGIRCAVDRTGRDGSVLHPEEALTVTEALRAYTSGAAWAAGVEDELGSLREGARASLTLLSENVAARPEALADCAVAATIVGGRVVFAT